MAALLALICSQRLLQLNSTPCTQTSAFPAGSAQTLLYTTISQPKAVIWLHFNGNLSHPPHSSCASKCGSQLSSWATLDVASLGATAEWLALSWSEKPFKKWDGS